MTQFWDTEIFIDEVKINDSKKVVVKHVTKGKNKFVDVRQCFLKGNDWIYGKGIAIPFDIGLQVGEAIVKSMSEGVKEVEEEEKVFEGF